MTNLEEQTSEFRRLAEANVGEGDLAQFPNPRAHELLVRWDMVETPPDILVTNYSMLNAMLMRAFEDPLFQQTRAWLDASHRPRVHPHRRRAAPLPGDPGQRGGHGGPEPAQPTGTGPGLPAAALHRNQRLAVW